MGTRIGIVEYYMRMAILVSLRSTCQRRNVGCVITDSKNRVLSVGYNGNPAGRLHCIDQPCKGAIADSGVDLDECDAIHAEISALGACYNIQNIDTVYCTTAPCVSCVKSLLATPCKQIVFKNDYPHSKRSKFLWMSSGRKWVCNS